MNRSVLKLLADLTCTTGRQETAQALAQQLGAEDLLLFIRDTQTKALLPAPGFVQTLPNGRAWRAFLDRCVQDGTATAELPFPGAGALNPLTTTTGWAGGEGSVLVLLGGAPSPEEAEEAALLLPLLAAAFSGEQLAQVVQAQADVARETENQTRQLAQSRENIRHELQRAYESAEEARRWLATTLHSIGDAVIVTDARGVVTYLNRVAEDLTGWIYEDAAGRPLEDVFVILSEKTRETVESPVTKVLRENRVVGLANHTILVARDGTERPIDDSGAPILDTNGAVLGVVLVFRDFTERRQAEQEILDHQADIEILNKRLQRAMTETHHRVKNNLQIISALVELQVLTGNTMVPVSELTRLSQHIRGLATIHDLLTQQSKETGETELLSIQSALDKLFPLLQGITKNRKLEFHIEDTFLPIQITTSLVVLTNELVSNATKHGKGDIGISFKVLGEQGRLEVWDSGPGFPQGFSPLTAGNTGMELIESVSHWDLRGEIQYLNRVGGGACVVVLFPLHLPDNDLTLKKTNQVSP